MHDSSTICPRHTDGGGIKKENEEEDGGGATEVKMIFYKESKSKKTKILSGGVGRGSCD